MRAWMLGIIAVLLCGVAMGMGGAQGAAEPRVAEPLRICVVGLVHNHVYTFFDRFRSRKDIEVVGVYEPNEELAAAYVKRTKLDKGIFYTDLGKMLDAVKPAAVVTYTDTFDHRMVVEACAKRGIHVMMEKPLAVSLEDARAIAAAAEAGKIQVMVNYETSWYASNHAAYDLVHDGSIGAVRKIVAHDGHKGPKEIGCSKEFLDWLTDPKLNGAGALFDFGCYGADLATWIMDGARPTSVTAVTQQIKPDVYPKVDDEATIVVTYPAAQLIIQASWNWPFDRKDLEVYGQKGSVLTDKLTGVRVRKPGMREEELVTAKKLESPADDPLNELRAVVMEGAKPSALSALSTNMVVMEILDAARESARTGKRVEIKQSEK